MGDIYDDYTGSRRINPTFLQTPQPMPIINFANVGPIKSDGGATDYYKIPAHATELRHLISFVNMSKSRGDIFKACWRLGNKDGNTIMYDLNKMKFFIDDLIEMHKRGEHL